MLIGEKKNGALTIKDAIPLFHQRVMTGPLEIAFDIIESTYPVTESNQIVGVYEATLATKGSDTNAS